MKKSPPAVAVFAAVDGSGGAGIVADCRAVSAAGALPLAITTAVTAQNLSRVYACWPLPPARIQAQFNAYAQMTFAAAKIGVIGNGAAAIARCLGHSAAPVVWDPVLAAGSGFSFTAADALARAQRYLLPRAHLITPNRAELLRLGGSRRPAAAIKSLFRAGCRRLLVTDIDGTGKTVRHILLAADAPSTPLWEISDKREAGCYHGSGCLFSSTLAARLACADDLVSAAETAHATVKKAIQQALSVPALGEQKLLNHTQI